MRKIGELFVFDDDEDIKNVIDLLKRMRKSKVSLEATFDSGLKLHNGKPSIPEHNAGFTKSKLLRDAVGGLDE